MTLQTFAIFVISGLMGTRPSLIALTVYLLMGTVGLPVFSGMTGGLGQLLGPTGRYLVEFMFTTLIIGKITLHFGRRPLTLALSMVLGMTAYYAFGTIWFTAVYMGSLDGETPVSLTTLMLISSPHSDKESSLCSPRRCAQTTPSAHTFPDW